MYKKECSKCRKPSYSLSAGGKWICPGCGADMSRLPVIARDVSTSNLLPVRAGTLHPQSLN